MRYTKIHATSYKGHCSLHLLIDGVEAEIYWEQKPTLLNNGFLFIQPQKIWSELLPTIILTFEDVYIHKLESFLKTEALPPIIFEMIGTGDFKAFNKKWAGIVIDEEANNQLRFDIKDE